MAWGAAEWGAVSTAAAGFMALAAAWWTVRATREAAAENSMLLKEQIEVQRLELAEAKANAAEADRRQKLFTAYSMFKLAGEVLSVLTYAVNNNQGQSLIIPHFSQDLVAKVEAAYPLQSYLNRENHTSFQLLDAIVHGEPVTDKEHGVNVIMKINAFRLALMPAVVGLPRGEGSRVYGHDGINPLIASPDVDI